MQLQPTATCRIGCYQQVRGECAFVGMAVLAPRGSPPPPLGFERLDKTGLLQQVQPLTACRRGRRPIPDKAQELTTLYHCELKGSLLKSDRKKLASARRSGSPICLFHAGMPVPGIPLFNVSRM